MRHIRDRLIFLHRIPQITRTSLKKIKKLDPTLTNIFSFTPHEMYQYFTIPIKKATIIYRTIRNRNFQKMYMLDKKNVKIVTIYDKQYPDQLKVIHDAPLVLYAKGDISLLKHYPNISVIGTRKPSTEAVDKLNYIVSPLIKRGWVIVSGMAYGIDSLAHQLALDSKGKTIAVLGSGFHHIYPRQNLQLFHRIAQSGLVITEYPPDVPPQRFHFPERNRIISGLCKAILVIEAMSKSGTSITVDQALDQGREVYAVPGSILIPQTRGCHKMIQEGAKLVMSVEDILEDWK